MTPQSVFDAENNVVGDARPINYRQYWCGLTDTERAFEILAGTDAAVFMQHWQEVYSRLPKPPIQP